MGNKVNTDALNAVITCQELSVISHTARFRCACGSIATADILTGEATCRCGAGKVADFIRRVEKQAIEREERQRREMRELMGERKVSRAKKVRGVWR